MMMISMAEGRRVDNQLEQKTTEQLQQLVATSTNQEVIARALKVLSRRGKV